MKTIIDKYTGQHLYAVISGIDVELQENEIMIDESLTEYFPNPYFNFETRSFYDKITLDETPME